MRQALICSLLAVAVTGCATMEVVMHEPDFDQRRASLSDEGVCGALFGAASLWKTAPGPLTKADAENYFNKVAAELRQRGRTEDWCVTRRKEMQEQRDTWAAIGVVALLVGAAAYAAKAPPSRSGSGNVSTLVDALPTSDTDWAWDEFYDDRWVLIWRCRGKQTLQWAPDDKCLLKPKIDSQWPRKSAY